MNGMLAPGGAFWLARHEIRLGLRDAMALMTAGKRGREKGVLAFLVLAAGLMHLLAWSVLSPVLVQGERDTLAMLILLCGLLLLPFFLMLSQAMEAVTRTFYTRSDLDLTLSSPTSVRVILTVKLGTIAISVTAMTLMLAAPAINMLAVLDGMAWLAAYPVILGLGLLATAAAFAATTALFALAGPRLTRTLAQILAAIVGAGFIIGIQLAAISSLGSLSRLQFLQSDQLREVAPDSASLMYIPARAAMGEIGALVSLSAFAIALFWLATVLLAPVFLSHVISAGGTTRVRARNDMREVAFRPRGIAATLRRKEWRLLARDAWLLSQSLMQILYLLPPAFMLWNGFAGEAGAGVVLVPVLVMAAGQLAGGLSWLAISGEDAPELVATAPIPPDLVLRAKVEAVLTVILLVSLPLLAALAAIDPAAGAIALCGIAAASICATLIQLWFRTQARRSSFRRRQTSSRFATFAEAFSSIGWAASAGLAAAGSFLWPVVALATLLLLIVTWRFSPHGAGAT